MESRQGLMLQPKLRQHGRPCPAHLTPSSVCACHAVEPRMSAPGQRGEAPCTRATTREAHAIECRRAASRGLLPELVPAGGAPRPRLPGKPRQRAGASWVEVAALGALQTRPGSGRRRAAPTRAGRRQKSRAISQLPAAPPEVSCGDTEDPRAPCAAGGTGAEVGPASWSGRDGVQAGKVSGDQV